MITVTHLVLNPLEEGSYSINFKQNDELSYNVGINYSFLKVIQLLIHQNNL